MLLSLDSSELLGHSQFMRAVAFCIFLSDFCAICWRQMGVFSGAAELLALLHPSLKLNKAMLVSQKHMSLFAMAESDGKATEGSTSHKSKVVKL